MPPMLNVTLGELMSGAEQHLLASDRSFRDGKGHHVLQLIAETVSAAQLIESGSRPNAAGERLIEQPAIQNYVHAFVGSVYLHCAERVVPLVKDVPENLVKVCGAITIEKVARFFFGFGLAEEKNYFHPSPGAQLDDRLQGGAGIQGCTCFAAERAAGFQRRGTFGATITSEEFRAIGGEGGLASGQISKSDATAEISVPCATCEERAGCRIHFGDDVGSCRGT